MTKRQHRQMNTQRPAALTNPAPLYVAGLFSMGYADFYIFLMPLYCLSLGMSAGEVGMIVGARSALAVFLSIHVGVLMDRFGTRRVTLFFVWTGICLAPVFPLVPWFWPLLLLQIVNGGALSFALVRVADADRAARRGRCRLYRPLQLFRADRHRRSRRSPAGWPGISAAPGRPICSARSGASLLDRRVAARARGAGRAARRARPRRRRPRFRLRDALPRLSDYLACFALMAIPAVAATMAIMLLRNATNSVQYSLYVVYLDHIGLAGTVIGVLFAAIEIASGFGSLSAGRAMRLGRPAEDDAERHRGRDPVDLRDAVPRRHLPAAAAGADRARLAAGAGPADDVLGAGESGRPLPPGLGGRAAPDREPALVDRHPADHGRHRRLVGHDRKFCRARGRAAAGLRADRADHAARRRGHRRSQQAPEPG